MRPRVLPNGIRHTEWALRAVDGLGLDVNTGLHVAVALVSLVRGAATNMEAEAEARMETGLNSDEWLRLQEPEMAKAFEPGPTRTWSASSATPRPTWTSIRCSSSALLGSWMASKR